MLSKWRLVQLLATNYNVVNAINIVMWLRSDLSQSPAHRLALTNVLLWKVNVFVGHTKMKNISWFLLTPSCYQAITGYYKKIVQVFEPSELRCTACWHASLLQGHPSSSLHYVLHHKILHKQQHYHVANCATPRALSQACNLYLSGYIEGGTQMQFYTVSWF